MLSPSRVTIACIGDEETGERDSVNAVAIERERTEWPRVLVIEEDEDQLFELTGARDNAEALAAIERDRPDVILLEVMLPGMSGIDVCRALRDRGISTPIIMMSSRNEELDVVLGIEVGADDYVAKPYRMRELVARIGAQLRRSLPAPAGEVARPRRPAVVSSPILSAGGIVTRSPSRTGKSRSRSGSSSCCGSSSSTRGGSSPATSCSNGCGVLTTTVTRASSRRSWVACGRASRSTRTIRRTSSRSAGSATGSTTDPEVEAGREPLPVLSWEPDGEATDSQR